MRLCLLLIFVTSSLFSITFPEVEEKYQQHRYDQFLKENAAIFERMGQNGEFDAFLQERRQMLQGLAYEVHSRIQVYKKHERELQSILKKQNQMLSIAIKKHPDLRITPVIENLIAYNKKAAEHRDAISRFALIEMGVLDLSTDPVAFQVYEICNDHVLKTYLVNSSVLKGSINQERATEFLVVLAFERDKEIKQICDEFPSHPSSMISLKALEVNHALLTLAFDSKYLNDLVTNVLQPENDVEQHVKGILQAFQNQQEKFFDNASIKARRT